MKNITLVIVLVSIVTISTAFIYNKNESWTPLLDKNLSKWEMYLSYAHKNGYKGEEIKDVNGNILKPIGYNKNVDNVFSIIEENGEPVLRISGQYYGCVFTKNEFENYHLKLQVKWGDKKWEPRLEEEKDSGILYHSQGQCGVDYWRSWMLSQELQIIEKSIGDYWCIANSVIDIKSIKSDSTKNFTYDPKGLNTAFGHKTKNGNFCQAKGNFEKAGEWNTIELITFQDKSLHIVNGNVVMALSGSRFTDGNTTKPLTKGKIQLQSEAAEVFYKDIQIKNINRIPEEFEVYFK